MEKSIFPDREVLPVLQRYVEVRLHTDKAKTEEERARSESLRRLKQERLNDVSLPIYEIVDPETGETLEVYRGADLPTGRAFLAFLKRHLR